MQHKGNAVPRAAAFLPPLPASRPPSGPQWQEIKHDGYRMLARREDERVRLITRNGIDWAVVETVAALKISSCLIDGEIAKCDERGIPVFDLLRSGPQRKPDVVLFAFDLLELDGADLTGAPIEQRKTALAKLLRKATPAVQLVEHAVGDGAILYAHACQPA